MKPAFSTVLLILVLTRIFAADCHEGDETLKYYLSKSDYAVLAKVQRMMVINDDPEMPIYLCTIKITDVYKGDKSLWGVSTNVSIQRLERNILRDADPNLKVGSSCIFFLKKSAPKNVPKIQEADVWFGVQPPNAAMGDAIVRLGR